MAHIQLGDAQAWLEGTKARLTTLDETLETHLSSEVLGRLNETFSNFVSDWTDYTNTPELVRQVISMLYAGWYYDRQYSEAVAGAGTGAGSSTTYGTVLRAEAEKIIQGLVSSSITIPEIAPGEPEVAPVFYPTDVSSTTDALEANTDTNDLSLGPALFGMQKVF